MVIKYVNLITAHFKWALNFLLHYSFFHLNVPEIGEDHQLSVATIGNNEAFRDQLCAVCLCRVQEGDEIRELRCNHLFHRVCLDRWIGHLPCATCPLCRDSLAPRRAVTELGREVLVFKFCSFTSSDDRETWWLR